MEDWKVDMDGVVDEAEGEAVLPADLSGGGEDSGGSFELRHLDNVVSVDRAKVVELAQKGMDYDRVRGKLEKARGELAELRAWLDDLSGGRDAREFRDELSAKALAAREGISEDAALSRVKAGREPDKPDASLRREREAREFIEAHPETAAEILGGRAAIPDRVWERVRAGESLLEAYDRHGAEAASEEKSRRIRELEAELAGARQAKTNALRSTGSLAGDGGEADYDALTAGWNAV